MPTIQAWDICAIALHTGERWHYHVDGKGLSGGGGAKPEVAQGSTPIYLQSSPFVSSESQLFTLSRTIIIIWPKSATVKSFQKGNFLHRYLKASISTACLGQAFITYQ